MSDTIYPMQIEISPQQPIGVFDSGVGGLSVLRAIRELLPQENVLYLADQAHIPYGPRQKAQIRDFSFGITDFLLAQGAKLIVVACNTASAAALHDLRAYYPDDPLCGDGTGGQTRRSGDPLRPGGRAGHADHLCR
jgi:glutamate racemase